MTTKTFGLKASGSEIIPEMLAKINRFALRALSVEEVFVRKVLLAHNCIDRDNERFHEDLLNDFARTLPGKSLLMGHARPNPGIGLFFDASTEEMTPEQFKLLTNDEPRLPETILKVKVLWGWVYILKSPQSEEVMLNIEGGVCRYFSIGFRVSDLTPVKGKYDNVIYWEYTGPGEALEGSLVWLGAQHGATVQKSAVSFSATIAADEDRAWDASSATSRLARWASEDGSGDKDKIDWPKYRKGFAWYDEKSLDNFGSYKMPHHDVIDGELVVVWKGVAAAMTALLGARGGVDIPEDDVQPVYNHLAKHYKQFDKTPPEKAQKGGSMKEFLEKIGKALGRVFTEQGVVEEVKAMLDEKDVKIKELTSLAVCGKAYRDGLVRNYIAMKAKLGEVVETPEAQDKVKAVADVYPIDFLKSEVAALEKRVIEKFPDNAQMKAEESSREKKAETGKENPFIPDEKKEGK